MLLPNQTRLRKFRKHGNEMYQIKMIGTWLPIPCCLVPFVVMPMPYKAIPTPVNIGFDTGMSGNVDFFNMREIMRRSKLSANKAKRQEHRIRDDERNHKRHKVMHTLPLALEDLPLQ